MVSTGVWGGGFDGLGFPALVDAARRVEDAGRSTLWMPETAGREAFSQAALLLSATTTLRIGCAAALLYARDPFTTRAAHRTLAEAFPGRFVLALGVGHPDLVEGLRGHVWGAPLPTMRRYLDGMDAAGPAPDGSPLLLATLGPRMTALAGRRTDGAHPLGMPVEHTRRTRELLGPARLLTVTQFVAPDGADDLARAAVEAALPNRRHLYAALGHSVLDDRLVDAVVARSRSLADRVAAHAEAGADEVNLHYLGREGE